MVKQSIRIPNVTYQTIKKNLPQVLWITVIVLVVAWVVSYLVAVFRRYTLIEGMTFGCDPNLTCSPESGCVPPTGIDGNCDEEVYVDSNKHYFKKCYYGCPDSTKACTYDMCCKGVCPPVYFRVSPPDTTHPSQIIHVDGVLQAGLPHSASSSSSPSPSSTNSTLTPSTTQSNAQTTTHQGTHGTPMPEFEPNTQQPATNPASFPSITPEESARKNKAFYEGDMSQSNQSPMYENVPNQSVQPNQSTQPLSYSSTQVRGGDIMGSQPAPSDGPKGYTDPLIL